VAIDARAKLFSRREADEALLFVGEPGSISGKVWLENPDEEQLELRRASLYSPYVRSTEPARGNRITQIPVPKYLPARQRQLVSIVFDLDPSTPPGTYDASVVLESADGTTTFPARIIVTPQYSLSIEPDRLVVTAAPGGAFAGEVVVVNDGNVPIDVLPLGEFPLEDPWREPRCCCCRDERASTDESESESDDEPEFGVVVLDNERATVEPGAFAFVKFVGRVPGELPPNMHLRAKPRIGIERFSLDVITPPGSAGEPRSESVRKRSPQTRKRS
jgi:hypothetical protein